MGLLSIEYPDSITPPEDDHPLLVQLALQLAGALHNSRLHRESVYLRDYLGKLLDNANAATLSALLRSMQRRFIGIGG